MLLIIDGYNILKHIVRSDFVSAEQRKWFLNMIRDYCAKKRHQAMIVFDGGPDRAVTTSRHGNITVVYSGFHLTADDYIKDYIEHGQLRDALLVSSDAAIYHTAKTYGVPTIESEAFEQLLKEFKGVSVKKEKKTSGHVVKISEDDNPELDELMREAGQYMTYKDAEPSNQKKMIQPKLTKHEKRLLKISKKL